MRWRPCRLGLCRCEFEGFGAKPLRADDCDEAIWQDALDGGVGSEVFELAHLKAANQRESLTAISKTDVP
jgi:hypothetical protein